MGFLRRRNAWFEALLARLKGIAEDGGGLSALIADDASLGEERARYDRESEEVQAEWRRISAAVPEAVRAEKDSLTRRGESLVAEIRNEYARIIGDVQRLSDDTKGAIEALARGRSLLRRYAPGDLGDAFFIDRNA